MCLGRIRYMARRGDRGGANTDSFDKLKILTSRARKPFIAPAVCVGIMAWTADLDDEVSDQSGRNRRFRRTDG